MIITRKALLGPDDSDTKHATMLNRLVTYGDKGGVPAVFIEPDSRHGDIIVAQMGLEGNSAKAVTTPGEKAADYYDDRPLETPGMCKAYRSICMRLGFMAQDAPHLAIAANKCCKHMARPILGGWARLKRVARFLKGARRCLCPGDADAVPQRQLGRLHRFRFRGRPAGPEKYVKCVCIPRQTFVEAQ
jgi:hypothetical protein